MSLNCPYCRTVNAESALVCACCARDIAIPHSLIAERDALLARREALTAELREAKRTLEAIRQGRG